MATREICKCCGRENPLGFSVPDDVWAAATPERYRNSVLCILCFDYWATVNNVDWTVTSIEWYPVSGASFAASEGQTPAEVALRVRPIPLPEPPPFDGVKTLRVKVTAEPTGPDVDPERLYEIEENVGKLLIGLSEWATQGILQPKHFTMLFDHRQPQPKEGD